MTTDIRLNVQNYFIQLIKDYVHGNRSKASEKDLDWDLLYKYASAQSLCGIIYYQCRDIQGISDKAKQRLNSGFLSDVYLSVNTDYEMEKIEKLFTENKIEYLPFKGSVIRNYYPHPELRTMGDRDILIHKEDCDKADAIMKSLKYNRMIDNHAVWTYTKPYVMFEIHNTMFYEHLSNNFNYRNYFENIWVFSHKTEESCRYTPDVKAHFLYMITHTAKHIINKGIGLRAFLDLTFFCRNRLPYQSHIEEWDWIVNELKRIKLYEFTAKCFSLCEKWFAIKMPFHDSEISETFIQQTEEKIFKDGLFGLENSDNAVAHTAKEIHRTQTYLTTAFKLTMNKLFPPYRDLQLIPWYSWVDGKPWLLPAAWIYRWFYCIFHKYRQGISLLSEPYAKRKLVNKRNMYLNQWGL